MPQQLLLGRYRILEQAGQGGYGAVYVAWDTSLQRKVAIKEIQLSELDAYRAAQGHASAPEALPWEEDPTAGLDVLAYPSDPDFLGGAAAEGPQVPADVRLNDVDQQRFFSHIPGLDEARAAAHLEDPNIVQVHDFQIVGTCAYIIMEYLDGMTLTQFLARYDDELTLDIIAAVFADVAHALEVAHENQVLHLDIKPDNIVITRKGVVKVTDFGLAALEDHEGNAYTHGGTIGYMPLEQMRQESLDARCDEWALASVAYEMLNGENPFLAPDLKGAEMAIERAELVLPSLMWNEFDAPGDDVLFYALDPDREERYETVTDFAEEFSRFLGDPKAGRKALHQLVSAGPAEEDADEWGEEEPAPLLRERITPKHISIANRVFAALATAAVAVLGGMNIPAVAAWGLVAVAVVAAVGAALGALRPGLGGLFAGLVWSVALLFDQSWLLGGALLVATCAWWWYAGREGRAAGTLAVAQPLFSGMLLPALGPLLAGYMLPAGKAAASAGYSCLLCFVLAAAGRGSLLSFDLLQASHFAGSALSITMVASQLVTTPGTWVVAASWVVAAVVLSLCCARGGRVMAVCGAAGALALCVLGLCGAQLANTNGLSFTPDALQVLLVVISAALVALACWLHVPSRTPKDRPIREDTDWEVQDDQGWDTE
ncbi:MAG: serine/threonine-protein kinase [Coriobacteriia bacterium]|nr:serine/threonine-protein kinase [Coriobacteriia bacterium]